jgi:quercetin dioxygenase-like cupin family protein
MQNDNIVDLGALAREQASAAAGASAGRAAVTLFGGHANTLRQTVIALTGGSQMSEHENPGEATVQVLSGQVRIVGESGQAREGGSGTLLVVPPERHRLEALEDSVLLLTVGKH